MIRPSWFCLLFAAGNSLSAAEKPDVPLLLVDALKPALGRYDDPHV
jgi:hypothetical protein